MGARELGMDSRASTPPLLAGGVLSLCIYPSSSLALHTILSTYHTLMSTTIPRYRGWDVGSMVAIHHGMHAMDVCTTSASYTAQEEYTCMLSLMLHLHLPLHLYHGIMVSWYHALRYHTTSTATKYYGMDGWQ